MAAGWRKVRVFISSTFRDMQAERDHLVRFVFPRLRAELLRRRVHLIDVDLRWGVTSEQDALSVCREIIDECRPRFLCMLGGRYGWTPPGEERSITADEVHHAALDHLDREEYRHFYFRDPAATDSIPDDSAREGGYREFPTEDDISEFGSERAQALAEERHRKLEALKQAIRDAGLPVTDYPCRWDVDKQRLVGLQAFGDAVYRDLMASIDDELGVDPPEAPDWFAEENAAMEAFIEERTERYVVGSRQALFDEMAAHADGSGEPGVLVVTGEPGSGKSALLGRFYRDYRASHPDEIVLPHFVGASRGSSSLRQMLRRLCHGLAEAAGIEDEIPEDVRELAQAFGEFLQRVAQTNRVVIVIDALNQLDATDTAHALTWLPWHLPAGVRLICSSLEHQVLEALRRRSGHVREIVCGPLTSDDAGAIMDSALARYHKRLDDAQRSALLAKPDARVPLYLLTALEELRTLGTYDFVTGRIQQLPGTVTELFDWVLQRLEEGVEGQEAFGEPLVSTYTSGIAIGRGGMTEGELGALCAPVDEDNGFWALHRMLRPYLMPRGELVDYFHGQLREAAERRYLSDDATRRRRHGQIARLLHDRADPLRSGDWRSCPALGGELRHGVTLRALTELPYHLTAAQDWAVLENVLTDLRFLESKAEAGLVFDLTVDFTSSVDATPRELPLGRHLRLLSQALRNDLHFISRHPATLFQCLWNSAWWYDCPEAAKHYDPPEGGWGAAGPPWEHSEPRLCTLLERWREEKEARQPGFYWVRSLRPPPQALGGAQIACLRGHEGGVTCAAYSPYGHRIASASADKTIRVWDVASGAEIACLRGHDGTVRSIAFSPDAQCIASASHDQALRLWEVDSGAQVACLRGHAKQVVSVAFSPDGTQLVSGSGNELLGPGTDHTVRVWDSAGGAELACLRGHDAPLTSVAWFPDGQRVVSGSIDTTARVWDTLSGAELICLRGHEAAVRSVAFAPDGRRIASGAEDNTVRVWDIQSGAEIACLLGHGNWVLSVAFSPDGRMLVSGAADGTVRVWDTMSGAEVPCLRGHEDEVMGVLFPADGRRLATRSRDDTVRLWDTGSGAELARLRGHDGCPDSLAASPHGQRIASGGGFRDHTVRIWDMCSGEELACMPGHRDAVRSVLFSPDGRLLASAGGWSDQTVRVWDTESGAELRCLTGHTDIVGSLAFSPDGRLLASGSHDQTVRVWAVDSGAEIACLRQWSQVHSLAFSADGRRLASGSRAYGGPDAEVRVWTSDGWAEIACLRGHAVRVGSVAFSPDGRRLTSGSDDMTVRIWDAESYECLETIDGSGDVAAIATGPPTYPYRAVVRTVETVIENALDSTATAWLALAPRNVSTHPSGRVWAGSVSNYLALIALEGSPRGAEHSETSQPPSS